jgi:hypothetical protein
MGTKAASIGVLFSGLLVANGAAVAGESIGAPLASPRIRIGHRREAAAVRAAVLGALRRLEREDCRRLFSEFADANGLPLQAGLDALGTTPQEYLGLIGFYDGSAQRRCSASVVLAFTSPGHRIVRVCPQFAQIQRDDPGLAEVVVLHEALHTLGLGENPPLSADITRRVAARCGR